MKKFWLFPMFCFVLVACEAKPLAMRRVIPVSEFLAAPATLKVVSAWCADNPGLRRKNPSCVNARAAELRRMSGNGSAPRFDTSPPK